MIENCARCRCRARRRPGIRWRQRQHYSRARSWPQTNKL